MKKLYLLTLVTLAACSSNGSTTSQTIDNTPGTKTSNEYKQTFPCSTQDSRWGICPTAAK